MADNFKVVGNVVGVPNPKSDVYSKAEINKLLANKVNKEDVVSAYKFCGSVENFEDLPHRYDLILDGTPKTHEGEDLSPDLYTYDEQTNSLTVNRNVGQIFIPIKSTLLKEGHYATYASAVFVNDDYLVLSNEEKIFTIKCQHPNIGSSLSSDMYVRDVLLDTTKGSINISNGRVVTIYKTSPDMFYIDVDGPHIGAKIFNGSLDNGDVYNVLEDGMNYAWASTEWDALGGEHKDLEARQQIGDIETALDEIIEIQNSLIGGESV